jgi:hypothetical protein
VVHWSGDRFPGTEKGIVYGTFHGLTATGEKLIIDTDASNIGYGGVISQMQDDSERVVSYFSKTLSKAEKNYFVTRRELLAIVKTL